MNPVNERLPVISIDKIAEALHRNVPLYLEEGRLSENDAKLVAYLMANAQTFANGVVAAFNIMTDMAGNKKLTEEEVTRYTYAYGEALARVSVLNSIREVMQKKEV